MGLAAFFFLFSSTLLFLLLLAADDTAYGETTTAKQLPSSCSNNIFQGDLHHINKSGIHLTLHHLHGPCSSLSTSPPPFADILRQDEARVRSLNSRLSKRGSAATKSSIEPRSESVSIPLKPGTTIGTGNYYINIGLGTPSKSYAMIVDTGSSLTWLQCQPCSVYCHNQVGATFDPTKSNTYQSVSCGATECSGLQAATLNPSSCSKKNVCLYQASYGDNSFSVGYLSRDTLALAPNETLSGFVYGCGQDNEGLFGQTAGLLGLSRDKLSMLGQLAPKYGFVFTYCLPSPSSTGSLSIGQSSFSPSAYKFTPMISDSRDSTLYFLHLTGITVAGTPISASAVAYRTSTIIDSGTVVSRLPTSVYTALSAAFAKGMSKYKRAPAYSILDTCFEGSSTSFSPPEVTMIFQGGAELKLGAQNTLVEVETGTSCLAFADNSDTSGVAIIGNLQQLTIKVAYDVSNSRIGFAAGGCT